MKYLILNFFFTVLAIFGSSNINAQTADLLPEASRELVTKIEHKDFTLTLEKFEDDGVPNLSMSKGYEFIRIGSDLESILNTLWPKRIFDISPELQMNNYHLMLQHLDQKRTEEFLDKVLEEFLNRSSFNIQLKDIVQDQYCLQLDFPKQLTNHIYKPNNGVIRSTTYSGDILTLSGYTLEEIAAEISNISNAIYSLDTNILSDLTYEVSINVMNSVTIKKSLDGYGISVIECKRQVEVIYFE